MTQSAIKAVIFDWAGTMIDFGCMAPVAALQEVFAAEGMTLSEPLARRDMGMAKIDHVRSLLSDKVVCEAWDSRHGNLPGEDDVQRIFRALEPSMAHAAARHCDLIPGAMQVFSEVKSRGIAVGSCTGYTRTMMAEILPRAAAEGYRPDAVVCAGETAMGRPSPLMIWKLLTELSIWPVRAVVKVDDAVVGIEEGLNAGCWTVGVAASGNGVGLGREAFEALSVAERDRRTKAAADELHAAGAHAVISTVADLLPVLDAIAARGGLPQPIN